MAHNKRRVVQKIMEENSLALARMQLPKEWVLHEYAPDYGIDFVVETFRFINPEQTIAETLGEFFFVQMKSVKSVSSVTKKVFKRFNVEKSVREDKDTVATIEVIPYALDVDEIQTIMSMGTAVPVVLFLADLSSGKIYWISPTMIPLRSSKETILDIGASPRPQYSLVYIARSSIVISLPSGNSGRFSS